VRDVDTTIAKSSRVHFHTTASQSSSGFIGGVPIVTRLPLFTEFMEWQPPPEWNVRLFS
jgi:hypothetical protein